MITKKFEIESFMTESLGLSGNELVLFALLWHESKGGKREVAGDYVGLSKAINTTIPTLYNVLKKLVERGYIEKAGETQGSGYKVLAAA